MIWTVEQADILNQPADVLICSANVFLNLSGGVGGELLLRYGDAMQRELHAHLAERNLRHVSQGDVIATSSCGTPFKAVLHAVAVDGFYQCTSGVIESIVRKSLQMAAQTHAHRVALTALGTGFGRLQMKVFARGIQPLLSEEFVPIEQVVVCVRKSDERDQILSVIGQ